MSTVVHFEIPYENAERAAAFYRAAFGWRYLPFFDTERNRNTLLQAARRGTP